MSDDSIRILVVDDNEELGSQLVTLLERDLKDPAPVIIRVTTFDEGEKLLHEEGFDLAILDVKDDATGAHGEDAGRRVFERVSEAQWLPVIFWTGVPDVVREYARPPLVQVVNKTEIRTVSALVLDALASGVPQFARQVAAGMQTATRRFLRQLVASQWEQMSEAEKEDVLPLLVNRLSFYLRNGFLDDLHLQGTSVAPYAHPSAARVYLLPPVTDRLTTGDLFSRGFEWWVLVTPQCDMEIRPKDNQMKAEYLRLVRALLPQHTTAGKAYLGPAGKEQTSATSKMKSMLGDDHRFFYLPAYLKVPHLLVDFEQVLAVPRDELPPPETLAMDDAVAAEATTGPTPAPWERVATIDSPFAEALLYRLSRAVARIGIEEIPLRPVLEVLDGLRAQALAAPKEGAEVAEAATA